MMYESNASFQDFQQKYPRGCHALFKKKKKKSSLEMQKRD